MQKKKRKKKRSVFCRVDECACGPAGAQSATECMLCHSAIILRERFISTPMFFCFVFVFFLPSSLSFSFFLPASRLILASTNSILFPWPFWRAGCPLLVCKCHVEKAETARSSTTESRKLILCTRALEKEETRRRRRKRRSRGKRWMRLW